MSTQMILELLRYAKIELAPGLNEAETHHAETTYGFRFPPDLRELLQAALPVGKSFPNWRTAPSEFIDGMMEWPLNGMLFDVEKNSFWMKDWEERPTDLEAAFEIARQEVAKAPKLIPVSGHRFLPAQPPEVGNPVFSVYQTDIIYYGSDLLEYFQNEMGKKYHLKGYGTTIRKIPLWSEIAEGE